MTRLPRPRSLRARLFAWIAATLAVAMVVTLATGAYLSRRSLERESLRSLARQVDLIAAQRGDKPIARKGAPDLGSFLATEQERLAILTPAQADLLLPEPAARTVRAGRTATGSLQIRATRYLFAARRNGSESLVLLRSARNQAADWRPFLVGLSVAGGIGAALAAAAAFLLSRAVARPISRVAAASRRLAAGEIPEPLSVTGADEVATLAADFNHLSAELQRAQDAERAFLLSVSHELKTPLTVIRGHAEAAADGVLDGPDAGAVIEREAGRLERLIGDLLDLARLRRRSFSIAPRTIDLTAVAADVVARYEPQSARFGVSLSAPGERPEPATGDPERLLQAVSNLVENALRCTPPGGAVRVLAAPGRLDVVDDGPGLDPTDVPRAFERFYLYERYGADRPVGTGLGLAIVRELVELMGGSVEVSSSVGVGSTFSIVLPVPPVPAARAAQPPRVPA